MGLLSSTIQAVPPAQINFRYLQQQQTQALKKLGLYYKKLILNRNSEDEWQWWIQWLLFDSVSKSSADTNKCKKIFEGKRRTKCYWKWVKKFGSFSWNIRSQLPQNTFQVIWMWRKIGSFETAGTHQNGDFSQRYFNMSARGEECESKFVYLTNYSSIFLGISTFSVRDKCPTKDLVQSIPLCVINLEESELQTNRKMLFVTPKKQYQIWYPLLLEMSIVCPLTS